MTKRHYVVEDADTGPHLASVKGGAGFAADGTKVLRITMSNGDDHVISFGTHQGARVLKDGVLSLSTSAVTGTWLRSYRDWSYYEEVAYKAPSSSQVSMF